MYPIPPTEKLVETKVCRHCQASFPITDKDLEFYDKVSPVFNGKKYGIPAPTLCPDCRKQRRASWWNRQKIYRRKCDYSGKEIIAMYPPETRFPVYEYGVWWGDAWDPLDCWQELSFSESIFSQIQHLAERVPRFSKSVFQSENSDYTNNVGLVRSCYLVFNCGESENCYYGSGIHYSKSAVDCLSLQNSEDCYECIGCIHNVRCFYSQECESCSDSYLLLNCRGCKNCFGCVNLVNAQYAIFNEVYTPDVYFERIATLLKSPSLRNDVSEFFSQHPTLSLRNVLSEWCKGDHIVRSKDCVFWFDVSDAESVRYVDDVDSIQDSMDIYSFGSGISLSYESAIIGNSSTRLLFCADSWDSVSDLVYCQICVQNCHHLFWCIGLRNKSYCILNKQYTKEEYETLVPKIIEYMMKIWEWGEFFPSSLSPFWYNETVAQEYYPLDRSSVIPAQAGIQPGNDDGSPGQARGWQNPTFVQGNIFNWSDYEPPFPKVEKIIPASKLPQDIKDVPDDILNWAIECEVTKKPFRIIKQELEFYRKHNLPIPKRHPDQRHLDRMAQRNPRKLFERKCDCCHKDMITTYAPERPERVYCEECYNKEVIG